MVYLLGTSYTVPGAQNNGLLRIYGWSSLMRYSPTRCIKASQGSSTVVCHDREHVAGQVVYCDKEGDVGRQVFVNSNECEPQAHIVLSAFVCSRTSCLSIKGTLYLFVRGDTV